MFSSSHFFASSLKVVVLEAFKCMSCCVRDGLEIERPGPPTQS